MENEEKNLTPEEEKKELDAVQALKEEDVRANIIEEYGFNEDDDSDKIDKLVGKEMDSAKKLSSAIGQKIKNRTIAEGLQIELDKKDPPTKPEVKTDEDLDKKIGDTFTSKFEEKALDDLNYPDELKDKIQKVAKEQDITIKKALLDPFIVFHLEEHKKEEVVDEAGISRTKVNFGNQTTPSDDKKMPTPDMNTEEGRKEWEDWKTDQIKKGN